MKHKTLTPLRKRGGRESLHEIRTMHLLKLGYSSPICTVYVLHESPVLRLLCTFHANVHVCTLNTSVESCGYKLHFGYHFGLRFMHINTYSLLTGTVDPGKHVSLLR